MASRDDGPNHSFRGAECLGSPELKLDISQLSPLLEKEMLAAVTDVFINERRQKFTEWIPNIISSEVKVGIDAVPSRLVTILV